MEAVATLIEAYNRLDAEKLHDRLNEKARAMLDSPGAALRILQGARDRRICT